MKPFHDKRYVFDVVYAAVIETLKSRGCEIERKVGFVDMEEAITAHRVLWQKNWDMGYPKDISQGEIEMISAQRRMEEESIIFIETWQDTTANLNKVMRQVLKEWKGQIF